MNNEGKTSWVPVTVVCLVVIITFATFYAIRYYSTTTTHEPRGVILTRLEIARSINAAQVDWLAIDVSATSNKDGPHNVMLYGNKDQKDIERILSAIRSIRLSARKVRVPAVREQIMIKTKRNGSVQLPGYFNPHRAPIISPSMRSADLSRIVHEIVKRKGEKIPKRQ